MGCGNGEERRDPSAPNNPALEPAEEPPLLWLDQGPLEAACSARAIIKGF